MTVKQKETFKALSTLSKKSPNQWFTVEDVMNARQDVDSENWSNHKFGQVSSWTYAYLESFGRMDLARSNSRGKWKLTDLGRQEAKKALCDASHK